MQQRQQQCSSAIQRHSARGAAGGGELTRSSSAACSLTRSSRLPRSSSVSRASTAPSRCGQSTALIIRPFPLPSLTASLLPLCRSLFHSALSLSLSDGRPPAEGLPRGGRGERRPSFSKAVAASSEGFLSGWQHTDALPAHSSGCESWAEDRHGGGGTRQQKEARAAAQQEGRG